MVTPLATSTPITQSLQNAYYIRHIATCKEIYLEPTSNEQVRSAYLERQMRQMDSVKLPSGIPSLEDGMVPRPESLQDRIQIFCHENRTNRKQEWESHRVALEKNERRQGMAATLTKAREEGCCVCSDATKS